MSSGLSGTCQSSILLSKDYNDKVQVVDNKRISITQKESVMEALTLASLGKSAKEIKEYLEETANQSSIYIMLNTLKYLKRGGRISPAAAAIGTMLKIKPILTSRGGKFEKFAMSLSTAQGKKRMISQIKKEIETEFKEAYENGKVTLSVAHTQNEVEAEKFKDEIIKEFPNAVFKYVNPLSLSVSCHIGPGALAIALSVNNTL
jgi:DegV family protein with EDD domain